MDPTIALLAANHEWDHLNPDFRDFLDVAPGFMALGLCQVWVLCRAGSNRVEGYYASAASCIGYGAVSPRDRAGYPCNPLPTIMLSQIARVGPVVEEQVETRLLAHFFQQAVLASHLVGVFAVELVADGAPVANYFDDLGFSRVASRTASERFRMYLPIATLVGGFQEANPNTLSPEA